jgi:AraC-like DNA-binding protein
MSRASASRVDRASQAPAASAGAPGSIVEFTTAGIAPKERLSFWRDGVLKRMVPLKALDEARPFEARLRRVVGIGVELVEHSSDAVLAERSQRRCAVDAIDDISIDLMLDCASARMEHGGERRVRIGDVCFVDYARPVQVLRSRHRAGALILSRQQVCDAVGGDPSSLAGRSMPREGLGKVLRSHLRLTLEEAPRLSPAERLVAIAAGVDMALAVLQAECHGAADVEQFDGGFYHAACRLIERDCADPQLTPEIVAVSLGSSRASLYRVFLRHGESVSAMIWEKRLDRAWRMLSSPGHETLLISEIAFRSGFLDQPTFNRMFKRKFGLTPREARNCADGKRSELRSP